MIRKIRGYWFLSVVILYLLLFSCALYMRFSRKNTPHIDDELMGMPQKSETWTDAHGVKREVIVKKEK